MMVILEIDGQKYGGQSYVNDKATDGDFEAQVRKLAQEVAETVFIHYGYGIEEFELNATLNEGENNGTTE